MQPGELEPAESALARGEGGLEACLDVAQRAALAVDALCDAARADAVWLGEDDPPIVDLDGIECAAWRAFIARTRAIAAED